MQVEPEWKLLQQFVVYGLQSAMETDASASIRPMNNNVSSPSQISSGFDTIAYAKCKIQQATFSVHIRLRIILVLSIEVAF